MLELIGIPKTKTKKKKNRTNFLERKQFHRGEKEKNQKEQVRRKE